MRPHSFVVFLQAERLETYIISDDTRHTSDFPVSSALWNAHSVNTHNRVIRVGNRKFLFSPREAFFTLQQYLLFGSEPRGMM